MLASLARLVFGTSNDRIVKRLRRTVAVINGLEPEVQALSDEALKERTQWLKKRLADGETLDDILPDAFATVREAAKRALGQRHYDVQLIGGMVLHEGRIAEMRTGEGKTLVGTLPVYLNALSGKGVHVVTVNDYLASRDAGWMGQVYRFLGLTVGCITHGLDDSQRRAAYACDVTYGTNNELGFDYLRDNMKFRLEDMVHRPFNFAIVDEVDSILIDEARTPLIISGPAQDSSEMYVAVDALIPGLPANGFEKDEKHRQVMLTDAGINHLEGVLRESGMMKEGGLYDTMNVSLLHHVQQALRAHKLYSRDVDYIVKDDQVVIIDEFTGRMMEGRRYSEGLHQALEAKEKAEIQRENQTLASITFQNLFRIYPKLAGMTGTALTESGEFAEIYNLEVVDIPTHIGVARKDRDDEIYRTAREKYDAIVKIIEDARKRMQPVLVGTTSIEKSELIANLLQQHNIPHQVLNARYHEQEATIIAQAGRPGAVTIATNMAGRGTDIQLGGNVEMRIATELGDVADPAEREARIAVIKTEIEAARKEVREAGGLLVIGTERHESRRIDNQLRGRSGRQGDPGASQFYLSLEDDLMRIFGGDRMKSMLEKLGIKEGEVITSPWISKAVASAQRKVEAHHFDVRKSLLKYDNVMNDQRKVVYEQRRDIMGAEDVAEDVAEMRHETIEKIVSRSVPPDSHAEEWDVEGLKADLHRVLNLELPVDEWLKAGSSTEELIAKVTEASDSQMASKAAQNGPEVLRYVEKSYLLQLLDMQWKEHLLTLDQLRQGIGLRAYAQKDPLNEYKREAFNLFQSMLSALREEVTTHLSHVRIQVETPQAFAPPPPEMIEGRGEEMPADEEPMSPEDAVSLRQLLGFGGAAAAQAMPEMATLPADAEEYETTSRNAPCPCGSGLKYKNCHGKLAAGADV